MSKSMFGIPPTPQAAADLEAWAVTLAPFEPRKLKVILDISNKCNLRCRMCHFSFDDVFLRPAQHMRPEMFETLAASVLPFAHTVILSAGNEPLMSPWFIDILRICAGYGVPNLLFITNGQLLSEKVAEAVLECGVTQVQISADGATRATYEHIRRGASFERLVRNLKYLTSRKQSLGRKQPLLQFNVVLMQRNLRELEKFVDLAEYVGVEWIAARHLLVVKNLNMEKESLAEDRRTADYFFHRFFQRVAGSRTVTVVEFPDFFDGYRMTNEGEAYSQTAAATASPPFGFVDLPPETQVQAHNAIQLIGWALDDVGIVKISIERDPFSYEDSGRMNCRGFIEVGKATQINGSRPDVVQAFPLHAHNFRAGWSFELRREVLGRESSIQAEIHVIAHNVAGQFTEIGHRTVSFSSDKNAEPYLFCSRPFDSVFIDSKGNVFPYPDCRPDKPFGSLAENGASIRDIWFGKSFTDLRQRVIKRDPPPMCLSCAYFINRNVDDPEYFRPK
jgi:MoaA/NifB/PqqE/SkfB family radical SAM enzyme